MATEFDNAVQALAWRLRDWKVTDAGVKAWQFIDDLVKRGWYAGRPELQARRPPRLEEQCRRHPGEYAGASCRCCASERLADRDEPQADLGGIPQQRTPDEWLKAARASVASAALCVHKVTPDACGACRLARAEPPKPTRVLGGKVADLAAEARDATRTPAACHPTPTTRPTTEPTEETT